MIWSIDAYCQHQYTADLTHFPQSTRDFVSQLNLPSMHPFCHEDAFELEGIPPMGKLLMERFHGHTVLDIIVSIGCMIAPPLVAMAELWLRLIAGAVGPLGVVYLTLLNLGIIPCEAFATSKRNNSQSALSIVVTLTVAACSVLMTDTLYVLENEEYFGALVFLTAVLLGTQTCVRHDLPCAAVIVFALTLLSIYIVWDGDELVFGNKFEQVNISQGFYFDSSNALVSRVVSLWPKEFRVYDRLHRATPWLVTGDGRTGIPFILNHLPRPSWHRFYVEVDEHEFVALDISFPSSGYDWKKPIYLVLHGLNGGSDEEYVRDLTFRRNSENSTVIVMVARGLMDLPIKGWSLFNGARTSDLHVVASAIQKNVSKKQVLVAVGYSMGAIILANYVASYGMRCALDGAIAISGGLDMRYQEHFLRAQRLWQPMLAETLRDDFLLGKWGYRVRAKLDNDEFLKMLRASHVTEIDKYAVVPYNGFDSLEHYYREMSALGDIDHDHDGTVPMNNDGKIHNVSIPLVIVHAFDDPLVTWRSTCQNIGFMHPENLVKSGSGYLMLLLTKSGGHVGWPLGWLPQKHKWEWMSDVAMSFASALSEAKGLDPMYQQDLEVGSSEVSTLRTFVDVPGPCDGGAKPVILKNFLFLPNYAIVHGIKLPRGVGVVDPWQKRMNCTPRRLSCCV
jgi:predicted alpha/beta-fold hydrolase